MTSYDKNGNISKGGYMRLPCLLLLAVIAGCAYKPTLFLSNFSNESGKVRVYIPPVTDQTNQYFADYQIEKQLQNAIYGEFEGIWMNSQEINMRPRYKRIDNPFIVVTSKEESDITLHLSVEQIYFGSMNRSAMASFVAFGLVGLAVTSMDNNKVIGLVSVRATIIKTANNDTLLIKYIPGKSKKDYPENLDRSSAMKEACKYVTSKMIGVLSLASDSHEALRYDRKHNPQKYYYEQRALSEGYQ